MRIERWHPGQLLIVWALTIGVAGWCFVQARDAKAALAQQFTAQLQELPSEPVFTFAIETLPAPRAAEVRRLARQAYDDSLRTILRKWQPQIEIRRRESAGYSVAALVVVLCTLGISWRWFGARAAMRARAS